MKLVSIDPGKKGALVVFDEGIVVHVDNLQQEAWGLKQTLPDNHWLANRLNIIQPATIVVERIGTSPRSGVSSAGNFLQGFGRIEGCCESYGLQYIRPQQWKAFCGLTGKPKEASVAKAIERVPSCEKFILGHKNIVDRADAVLIGYAWMKLNGIKSRWEL